MDTSPSPRPADIAVARRPSRRGRWIALAVVLAVAGVVMWRHPWSQHAAPARHRRGAADPNAPTSVTVARVSRGDLPVVLTELGTVTPLVTATIKSQISGYLTQVAFQEGMDVRKGDFLAQVDPRPYQAALEQFQGNMMRDEALMRNAQLDLTRYQNLSRLDSIARQNVDTQASLVAQYKGAIRTDQGNIDAQQLNITYTHITAPADGRLGLRQVDVGNYVTPGDTTGLVVLTQLRPITVIFTIPQTQLTPVLLRLRQVGGAGLPVTAYATDATTVVGTGTVNTIDNQIDTTTGTVKLRAMFANAGETLFPNEFVNTTLLVDTVRDALVVPSEAVQRGTPGTYVWLVGADHKVSLRVIGVGVSANGMTAVTSGLGLGDAVVLDGISRLHAGSAVKVVPAGTATTGAAADDGSGDDAKVGGGTQ